MNERPACFLDVWQGKGLQSLFSDVWQLKELGLEFAARATRDAEMARIWWSEGCHPGGNADDYQNKGIAGKAICKTMKTKG